MFFLGMCLRSAISNLNRTHRGDKSESTRTSWQYALPRPSQVGNMTKIEPEPALS